MKSATYIIFILLLFLTTGCKFGGEEEKSDFSGEQSSLQGKELPVNHASGFRIVDHGQFKVLTIENPWPKSEKAYTYLLYEEEAEIPADISYDSRIKIPVESMVVTSTTHIPSLEALNEEESLTGFPGLKYISSKKTRNRIDQGLVQELGKNEDINTEILLNLHPDVVIGFAVDGSNRTFNTIEKSGIPVVYNSDWTENSPLGKAEWIKFFGVFFNKFEEAETYFREVEHSYLEARILAENSSESPTVLAGSMYKDQWYLPAGDSWHGQFFKDANTQYLFSETEGTGSLSLSFEAVLAKARDASFWIGPAQFQSYSEMRDASPHYTQFSAFKAKQIYTFSSEKGETGGVLFYEMAPNRPDLVLKDLISIFHPALLPEYETTFYKPLK